MKQLFYWILFVLTTETKAQIPDFYVYSIKGQVRLIKSPVKKIQLKQQDYVFISDKIELGDNSEVQIVNKEQQYLHFDSKGIYLISQYASNLKIQGPGITKT